jgi:hypothetical protein
VDMTHTQRQGGFESDVLSASSDSIRFRDLLRTTGTYKPEALPPLTLAVDATRDQLDAGGQRIGVNGRVSTMLKGTAISNSLNWQDSEGLKTVQGSLQLSRRVMDVGLNGQLGYTLLPRAALQNYSLAADRALGDSYRLIAGFEHTISSPLTQVSLGLTKSLGSLGLSGSYNSQHQIALSLQLFFSLGRDPRTSS